MKIRHLKHIHLAAMFGGRRLIPSSLGIRNYLPEPGEVLTVLDQSGSMSGITFNDVVAAAVTDVYVVSRVKDGEVVLETESRSEALALIEKHARQKKAKLVAHVNGEPVLFNEEEMTS
jgi:hypothetical protein